MDELSETESDCSAKWVRKLRTRFAQLGLNSKPGTEVNSGNDSDYITSYSKKKDFRTPERSFVHQEREREGRLESNDLYSSPRASHSHSGSTLHPKAHPGLTTRNLSRDIHRNQDFSNISRVISESDDDSTDVDFLHQKKARHDHKSLSNFAKVLDRKERHFPKTRNNFSYESQRSNEFYITPETVSNTTSWDKHDWRYNMSNGFGSPPDSNEPSPRLKSSEENVNLMLDWWGLKDMSGNPELSKYLPDSKKSSKDFGKGAQGSGIPSKDHGKSAGITLGNAGISSCNSGKSAVNSGIGLENAVALSSWDSEKLSGYSTKADNMNNSDSYQHSFNNDIPTSEHEFHVFPVGFDGIEPSSKPCSQFDAPVDPSYSSSDSDYTNDDPLPKPKSPASPNENASSFGSSPRNLMPHQNSNSILAFSKSPPEPQIQGSLYHEFSNKTPLESGNIDGHLKDDGGYVLTLREKQSRPRSQSQPSITEHSYNDFDFFSNKMHSNVTAGQSSSVGNESCKKSVLNAEAKIFVQKEHRKLDKFKKGGNLCEQLSNEESLFLQHNLTNNSSERSCNHERKICSECDMVNSISSNWCSECGAVINNVRLSTTPDQSTNTRQNKQNVLNEKQLKPNSLVSSNLKNPRKNPEKILASEGRRWEKSSLAWNTYKDSHLSKPPTGKASKNKHKTSTGREMNNDRPRSATCKTLRKKDGAIFDNGIVGGRSTSNKMQELRNTKKNGNNTEMAIKGNNKAVEKKIQKRPDLKIDLTGLNDGISSQVIQSNNSHPLPPVPYLYLPDEVILHIFAYLSHTDLASCAHVCRQLKRICEDESLWRTIVMRKNKNITDELLEKIGSKKPVNLSLIQCRGNEVTASGLRELFRQCGDNLQELNFSGCNGGQFIGESILLHVALRCTNLRSVDASWSNVGDNGIEALVQNVLRLECLCLNGCQAITDHALNVIGEKHGNTLKTFEIFGCFNVSVNAIKKLGKQCPNLRTLSLGQCYKITSSVIGQIVSNLEYIVNLDLRGCKQARDGCVKMIAKHCPLLVNLVLANCQQITDIAMTEIANNLPSVESLDICGCVKVTDHGVRVLAQSCNRLNYLDLSSTGITKKSVVTLANYCSQNLQSLKLSFCVDVTDDSVSRLVRHCKRMTTLHLYGCKRLRNMEALQKLNKALNVEF